MEGKMAFDSAVRYEGRMHMRTTKTQSIASGQECSSSSSVCVADFDVASLNACVAEQAFTTRSSSFVDGGSDKCPHAVDAVDDPHSCSEEVGTPIVKNTFIECRIKARPVRRRKTLPASWRVAQEHCRIPRSDVYADFGTCSAATDSWALIASSRSEEADALAETEVASDADSLSQTPSAEDVTERKITIAEHFAEVIQEASSMLEVSDFFESVETSCGPHGCAILLRPCGGKDTSTAQILALAQQSLRDAAAKSKVAYILGYCSPSMTAISPLGFEITLGAMKNAKLACWHMFKRGICRHGDRCRWQHPSCKLPVRVLVEVAEFEAPSSCIHDFQVQVAKVVNSIASSLQQNQNVSHASVCEDKISNGWTIAVTPLCPMETCEEDLNGLAEAAVIGTTLDSQVALMGIEAQPFVPRAGGFTIVLGNRKTARKPCSNMYDWGSCKRGCSCTFEHPTCLVPIQVVTSAK